ncbi:MAG: ABC transporter permease [Thermoanaerobaculia bacterium]
MNALHELAVTRTKEFIRQPEAVFWVFGFPILLAFALGFAFREKAPDRTPVGIVAGPETARAAASLKSSPALIVRTYDEAAGRDALRTGKISLLIELTPKVVYRFDPTRPDSRIARLEADAALQNAAGRRDPVRVEEIKVTEPGARYIDFLIPGLLGLNLMGTGMWGVGFSIVTARQQKLLKRLVATPMRKSDYLLSAMLSRLIFLVLEVVALVGFGWLIFDVAVRGSLVLFSVICLVGAGAFSGLGLLVAARATTIEGVSGLMNFVMLPMWILSGVFFSTERFPDSFQTWIRLLPLTALNDALREVMTDARGIAAVGPELAIMLLWGVIAFVVALRIFRWT